MFFARCFPSRQLTAFLLASLHGGTSILLFGSLFLGDRALAQSGSTLDLWQKSPRLKSRATQAKPAYAGYGILAKNLFLHPSEKPGFLHKLPLEIPNLSKRNPVSELVVETRYQLSQTLPALPSPPPSTPPSPQNNPLQVPSLPQPQRFPTPVEEFDASPADKFRLYRLGPGDQIFIQVQRFPDLNFNGAISPEGQIIMPLIGTVFVQGLTLEQAQAEIRQRLNQFFVDPIVSIELLVQRPVSVTITGEVARPGLYFLPSGYTKISDALQAAGGVNPASDLRSVLVRRTLGDRSVIEQRLDLLTPLQIGGSLPSLRLSDGDVIIVPKQEIARALNYDSAIVAKSTLASQTPIQISVTGEVSKPGFYILSPLNARVSDALQFAGGVTAASNLAAVKVRRTLANGSVIEQSLDILTPLQTGVPLPTLPLADGDAIVVPKREISSAEDNQSALVASSTLASTAPVQVTITGEVAKPGFYALPPGNTRVSDALLVAGGIAQNADLRAVRVRRARGDGSFSEETLDFFTPLQTSQALPDLRLATGDAIVVPTLEAGGDRGYDRRLISRSTLAKPTINIRILSYAGGGTGTVSLPNGSSFTDALGGIPLDTADLRKVALIRFDPEQGKAVTLHLDAKEALKGDPAQNPLLQDNDAIVIGRNLVARISYALNTFTQPFRDILGFLLFFSSLQNSARDLFGPGN